MTSTSAKDDRFTLLTASRLIDGEGNPAIEDAAVLIHNDRIELVGSSTEVRAPDGAEVEVVDYGDASIVPGMVDAHTHLVSPGDGTPSDVVGQEKDDILLMQAIKNSRTILHSGVTSIRENGAKNHVTFSLREGIERGLAVGPKMTLCGRPVTITGGHMWYFGAEADGADEVRKQVRQLIKEGADYIKLVATGGSTRESNPLLPSYTVDELRVATEEAHHFGKLTAAHCASAQGVQNCLDADVDMIVHCVFEDAQGRYEYRPDLVDRLLEADAWVNPTLYVAQAGIDRFAEVVESAGDDAPALQAVLDERRRGLDNRMEACGRMMEAGVKMTAGSDSPWGDYAPGEFVHEVLMLSDAGLSAPDALASGMSGAADSIGMGDISGRLVAGRSADLLVVNGDPSKDLKALWNVVDVYQDGNRVERGVL
ncbi:MAG: amidohydrolase family protein [Chloroflexi bacterium]|jgi:imidazolonepropionase-like amidohydrolase|nr:amidohydrolase family protein [Chloroflexota bacterium]MBT4073841.1 amidohydrolase family protein [Chloroflexota bacterium]MBT6680987.1 amidohydrolase family protein [Chloroflexota bacterium]